ncbi:MAG: CinA family nicotinamide mononucleotide deamidase-related protein [Alphaproteobacteria bacterium]|nr:CinA family nicotinamide mononucleotide deamidase-related protein [Alphaproteobacteria bacterium]MCB9928232.1 CinA family nicotinamide mononucleotide deamidase-related protein [Alphaproteobacteria bacterium]
MRIEIICTGDEVLSGKTVNTNFSHISRRLQEEGLPVTWETTVGDDRPTLIEAFRLASTRADAVIVNGGLGPTKDDLSQEVAAEVAGVGLALWPDWLAKIEAFYAERGRAMPPNNRKQAMLPEGSELIDNPVGTACGFQIDIGKARFYFTPGVPREVYRMLEDQLIPRLRQLFGVRQVNYLKRFHSFGLGESRVDNLLSGVEDLAPAGAVKLGFQAHYPQLETKLAVQAPTLEEAMAIVAPVADEVRRRLGNVILAEDDDSLESVILAALSAAGGDVAIAEVGTFGQVGMRLAAADPEGGVFRRSAATNRRHDLATLLDLASEDEALVENAASTVRVQTGTSHGLAILVDTSGARDPQIEIAIATADHVVRRGSNLVGNGERVRNGAVEMALDSLRRLLTGKPVDEVLDFERAPR